MMDDDLTESLTKMQAEMDADIKKRKALESLPLEVILKARKMEAQKKFQREVVKRTPRDFYRDTLVLECGHTTSSHAGSEDGPKQCQDCVERWLLRHVPRSPQKTAKKKAGK